MTVNANDVRVLTIEEERNILKSIINNEYEYIGQGASRFVYALPWEKAQELGFDTYYDYVIKVAFGIAGFHQMKNEVSFYLDFLSQGREHILAHIEAYGHFIEIMERVRVGLTYDVQDIYTDVFEYEYDNNSEDFNDTYIELNKAGIADYLIDDIIDVWCALTEVNGAIGDNCQIGISIEDNVVVYDCGYNLDTNENMCSQLSYEFNINNSRYDWIERCIDTIDNMLDVYYTFSQMEEDFASDYNIKLYGDCDDEEYEEDEETESFNPEYVNDRGNENAD